MQKNDCFAVYCDLNLWECHRYIEDNAWVSVDMGYLFEWLALYLTPDYYKQPCDNLFIIYTASYLYFPLFSLKKRIPAVTKNTNDCS